MSTVLRDPWSDARLVATQKVLDDDVAAVRRRAWVRQVLVLALGLGAAVGASSLVGALAGSSLDDLSWPSGRFFRAGTASGSSGSS